MSGIISVSQLPWRLGGGGRVVAVRGWGGGLTFTLCTAHAHHTPTQWMFTLLSIVLCSGCWVQTPHQPSLGQLYLLSILNISSKMTGPSRPAQQSIEMRRHNPVLLWPLCCQSVPSLGQRKDRLGPRLGQRPAWACPGEQQRENICFN